MQRPLLPGVWFSMRFLSPFYLGAVMVFASVSTAAEPPPVTAPRATSGDTRVEPDWSQRLTITVGPAKADLVGTSERALQAAVDYVARLGGGTVKVLPGTYRLRNAVYLQSKVRLVGSGPETVLIKEPSVDHQAGGGQRLVRPGNHAGGCERLSRSATASASARRTRAAAAKPWSNERWSRATDNRFKLDRPLRENFWRVNERTVSTLFPILSGEIISDVVIENLTLDGNREHNDNLDGNYAGCIFLQDCSASTSAA